MSGDEISMETRQEYVLDLKRVLGGKGNVLVGVPLRANNRRRARLLVPNNLGSMSQARQVELFKDHAASPSLAFATSAGEQSADKAGAPSSRQGTSAWPLPPSPLAE
jgi:hypothetical protein